MVSMESIENRSIVFGNCPMCHHVGTLAISPSDPHSLNLNHRPILNWKRNRDERGNKNEIQWKLCDKKVNKRSFNWMIFGQFTEWEFSQKPKHRIDYRQSATPRHAMRKIMSCNYWIGERFLTSFSFRWIFASQRRRWRRRQRCEKWKWNAIFIVKNNYLVWRTPPRLWLHSKSWISPTEPLSLSNFVCNLLHANDLNLHIRSLSPCLSNCVHSMCLCTSFLCFGAFINASGNGVACICCC